MAALAADPLSTYNKLFVIPEVLFLTAKKTYRHGYGTDDVCTFVICLSNFHDGVMTALDEMQAAVPAQKRIKLAELNRVPAGFDEFPYRSQLEDLFTAKRVLAVAARFYVKHKDRLDAIKAKGIKKKAIVLQGQLFWESCFLHWLAELEA